MWYMHTPEAVLENEILKIPWGFRIQTDHLIQVKRPDVTLIKKKKKELYIPVDHKVKIKEVGPILGSCRRANKAKEHHKDSGTNCS